MTAMIIGALIVIGALLGSVYFLRSKKAQSSSIPFASKITPRYTWEDIMLPDDKKEQLRKICNYAKHSVGKSIIAVFSGPSETGKTMAAEIIAQKLKLDMYRIDLSMVVSKYIGETEKNLGRIFDAAEKGNVILFFDQADALFGKRSEARDAHDRYANIEINYLLQRMEKYGGVVILATNSRKSVDEGLLKTKHYVIEIPFPPKEYRRS